MNEITVEKHLRSMQPVGPSAGLMARIQRDMELNQLLAYETVQRKRTTVWSARLGWAAFGAAAAIVLSMALPQRAPSTLASIATTPVINSSRELLDINEGDIVIGSDGTPGQVVSVASIERHRWVDPTDGAEYIVEVPQEDDLLVPVHFQ